jgi:hypothetical protein
MINLENAVDLNILPEQIFIILLSSTLGGFLIALVYKKTHRSLSYSVSFTNTLLLITIITAMVLLVIGGNVARAIGIFGAFSIIRFRTSIKDPRDLTFIFMALVSGFAIGAGAIWVVGIGIPFLLILTLILYYTGFGELPKFDYILHCKTCTKEYNEESFAKFLKKSFKEHQLLNVESRKKGKVLILNFNVKLKGRKSIDKILKDLHKYPGILEVYAVRSKNDLDFK